MDPITGEATAVIVVASFDNRIVVAFPSAVWHRSPGQRKLAKRAFIRPLSCSVTTCPLEDRGTEREESLKIWVGFLHLDFEPLLSFQDEKEPAHQFGSASDGTVLIPTAQALVDITLEHYAPPNFVSAVSQGEGQTHPAEERLAKLEESLQSIQACYGRRSFCEANTKRRCEASACKSSICLEDTHVSWLRRIDSVSSFASRNPICSSRRTCRDHLHQANSTRRPSLQEAYGECRPVGRECRGGRRRGGGGSSARSRPMTPEAEVSQALVKLTKICSNLAEGKKKTDGLEALLDGSGLASSSESTSVPFESTKCCSSVRTSKGSPGSSQADLRSYRKQPDGRFRKQASRTWRTYGARNCEGLALQQVPDPAVHKPDQMDLGSERHMGLSDCWKDCRSKSSLQPSCRGLRPIEHRWRELAVSQCCVARTKSPLSSVRKSPSSGGTRSTAQCLVRQQVDRSVHVACPRARSVPGSSAKARSSGQDTRQRRRHQSPVQQPK